MSRKTPSDTLLSRLGAPVGLCADCRYRELLQSERSIFLRCGLERFDPRFAKYPPLPVTACAGYAPIGNSRTES